MDTILISRCLYAIINNFLGIILGVIIFLEVILLFIYIKYKKVLMSIGNYHIISNIIYTLSKKILLD